MHIIVQFRFISKVGIRIFKGCVRYNFASLFCKFKWEYLWNKVKCFLFLLWKLFLFLR